MARPKTYTVKLSQEERLTLKKIAKKKDTSQTVSARCRILLALDENAAGGMTYEKCMALHDVSRGMIAGTVKKFAEGGIEAVLTIKRNVNSDNSMRKVDGRMEANLIRIACAPAPEGHARWTLRLLASESKVLLGTQVGKDAIARALKKTGFAPTAPTTGAYRRRKTRNL